MHGFAGCIETADRSYLHRPLKRDGRQEARLANSNAVIQAVGTFRLMVTGKQIL